MYSKIAILAFAIICSAISAQGKTAAASYVQAKADRTLMNYMIQSRAAPAGNSMECFNYYIPVLNGISQTYQKNYEACLSTRDAEVDALVQQEDESRDSITSITNGVCQQFSNCQAETDNLKFFDCYSNLGDQSVRSVYGASLDASEAGATYRESYRQIEIKSERCTNETQRVYVTDTANAYDELDDCLINGLKVTTTTTEEPTTTTTEEPTTTTEEPTTTTEEPTTTTEEPTTTTEEPTTTTEEPTTTTEEPTTTTEEPTTTTEEPTTTTEEPTTTTEEPTTTTEEPTTTTEEPTTTTEEPTTTTEEPTTTTEEPTTTEETTTAEADPVEELSMADNSVRARLESFMKNWGKHAA